MFKKALSTCSQLHNCGQLLVALTGLSRVTIRLWARDSAYDCEMKVNALSARGARLTRTKPFEQMPNTSRQFLGVGRRTTGLSEGRLGQSPRKTCPILFFFVVR